MNNIKKLRKFFRSFMIDGYLVAKMMITLMNMSANLATD